VQTPRRPAFFPALAIVVIAGWVGACGVKGEPERPTDPRPELSAQPDGAPGTLRTTKKIFTEESRVTGSSRDDILPQMPPKEWSKSREFQSARDKGKSKDKNEPDSASREPSPDRPFILDWLL
jgi:hypothetical protein